jgi:hypothetical protein
LLFPYIKSKNDQFALWIDARICSAIYNTLMYTKCKEEPTVVRKSTVNYIEVRGDDMSSLRGIKNQAECISRGYREWSAH